MVPEEDRGRFLDAACFTLLPVLAIAVVGIGFISGDALAQAGLISARPLPLNPNHLLLEPAGALWLAIARSLGAHGPVPDTLKWLSVFAGAVSLAFFRIHLVSPLAPSRSLANVATAVLMLSSAFDRLWVSGESHMIQLPFLVLLLAGALRMGQADEENKGRAFALCLAGGIGSCLTFISNSLLVTGLLGVLVIRGTPRQRQAVIGTWSLIAALTAATFFAAWKIHAPGASWLAWMTSYGGGAVPAQTLTGYGMRPSVAGVLEAGTRAGFGFLSVLVDLAPLSDLLRRGVGSLAVAAAHTIAGLLGWFGLLVAASRSIRDPGHWGRQVAALLLGLTIPVLLFGILWNNSDDQFYFQVSPGLAALSIWAMEPARRWRALIWVGVLPAAINVRDLYVNYIGYPREHRIAEFRAAVRGAALIVIPGRDEAGHLLYYAPDLARRSVLVSSLAETAPPTEGLRRLRDTVGIILARGDTVAFVNFQARYARRQPWPLLSTMGYGWDSITQVERQSRLVRESMIGPAISVGLAISKSVR